jgi:hypothetical protein
MSNCISRLTVEEDAWERRDRCRQEDEAEKLEVAEVEAFRKSKQKIQLDHQDGKREISHHSKQEEFLIIPNRRNISWEELFTHPALNMGSHILPGL